MGLTGALFAASTALSVGTSLYTSGQQANAMTAQGQYQNQQLKFNAGVADLQSKDAINRGNVAIADTKTKTKQIIGSQRAALAAQGIEVNSDTSSQIQQDTAELGATDAQTIKNNAWRESWGYQVQALDYNSQAEFALNSSKFNAQQTLLTGGLNAARDVTSGALAYKNYAKVK